MDHGSIRVWIETQDKYWKLCHTGFKSNPNTTSIFWERHWMRPNIPIRNIRTIPIIFLFFISLFWKKIFGDWNNRCFVHHEGNIIYATKIISTKWSSPVLIQIWAHLRAFSKNFTTTSYSILSTSYSMFFLRVTKFYLWHVPVDKWFDKEKKPKKIDLDK